MIFRLPKSRGAGDGDKRNLLTVPMLPLRDIVIFPHMVVPLFIGRERSIHALEYAMGQEKHILLCTQKDPRKDEPREGEIHRLGTLAAILQLLRLPDGTVKVLVEGKSRAITRQFLPISQFFQVEAEELLESWEITPETEALRRTAIAGFETYAKLNKKVPQEAMQSLVGVDDPGRLADTIAGHLSIKADEKQGLLENLDASRRLEQVLGYVNRENEILQIESRIKNRVKKQMEKTQREYYLNEQMRAIQKEMGEKEDLKGEIQELERRIRRKKMSAEATAKVKHELKKLKLMSPMSAEATVSRNYIDWMLSLPWQEKTKDKHSLEEAERILARRPLWPGKAQGAHPGTPGGPEPGQKDERAHPLSGGAAGRGQNLPGQVRGPGHGTELRAPVPGRACGTKPRSAATGAPISARCPARSSSP